VHGYTLPSSGLPRVLRNICLLLRQKLESLERTAVDVLLRVGSGAKLQWLPECINSCKPPDISPEAVIVIPILESISNSVSALPIAAPSAQAAAVQQSGGLASTFAEAFAAARRLSSDAATGAGEAEEPVAPVVKSAEAAMSMVMRSAASTNLQVRKVLSHDGVAASTIAAATQILPTTQASILPAPTISPAEIISGSSRSGANESFSIESGLSKSGLNESGSEIAASAPRQGATAGSLYPAPLSSEAAEGDSRFPEIANGSRGNGLKDAPVSEEPTELAENTLPSALDSTTQPAMAATLAKLPTVGLSSGMWDSHSGLDSTDAISATNLIADGSPSGPTLFGPTLSGSTLSDPAFSSPVLSGPALSGTAKIAQENSGDDVVPNIVAKVVPTAAQSVAQNVAPDPVIQNGVPAQTETENPLAAIFSGQAVPSNDLNPAVPAGSVRAVLQSAAAKAGSAVAGVRAGSGARTSILGAAASPASGATGAASVEDPAGNQTPFSVFFSSAGPGTESAASSLPKLILPPNGTALRDSHGTGANASSTNTQNSPSSSTGLSNGASSNTPPSMKDSLDSSASESLQTAPVLHRDTDGNAAGAQLAVAATGTTAVAAPAPPSSAAITLPLASPAQGSESLQKPELPSAPAAPPGAAPASEALPTPVAGPVQVAQMANRIGQSEMRIGMNTSAFGSVEVRTVVHANDVGLVIGSEKGDLRTLLANDMPAITNTLQQQNLRLNSVNFMQGFAFSNNASGGGDSRQQSFVPTRAASGGGSPEATVDDSLESSAAGAYAGSGLSILA
jgi:hypothetical protein